MLSSVVFLLRLCDARLCGAVNLLACGLFSFHLCRYMLVYIRDDAMPHIMFPAPPENDFMRTHPVPALSLDAKPDKFFQRWQAGALGT